MVFRKKKNIFEWILVDFRWISSLQEQNLSREVVKMLVLEAQTEL